MHQEKTQEYFDKETDDWFADCERGATHEHQDSVSEYLENFKDPAMAKQHILDLEKYHKDPAITGLLEVNFIEELNEFVTIKLLHLETGYAMQTHANTGIPMVIVFSEFFEHLKKVLTH